MTMQEKEEDTVETNVVPLKLITGGKPPTDNWLSGLPVRSSFLTRPKESKGLVIKLYHVVAQRNRGTLLLDNDGPQEVYFWVPTQDFSNQMECFEVLHVGKEEE